MTATLDPLAVSVTAAELEPALEAACARIAPAWPLDRMIAVNPWWGFVGQPIEAAASELATLAGARLLMPRNWYLAQWRAGRFGERHLAQAVAESGAHRPVRELVAALEENAPPPAIRPLVTDLVDRDRDLAHQMAWGEYVTRHISQAAAACFDEGQGPWGPDRSAGLYPLWRSLSEVDGGPRLLMGLRGFGAAVAELPADPRTLIAQAVDTFRVPASARAAWFTALLMTVNGWASHCAYRRWEARLRGGDDDQLVHLLAVRLAWELVLYRAGDPADIAARWAAARSEWSEPLPAPRPADRDDWIVQRALELAYQERLQGSLERQTAVPVATPWAQAAFCIDVRSEVFRRALEAAEPGIATLGFAGFFGVPIAYAAPTGPARPQLPGLLAPGLVARDVGPGAANAARQLENALDRGATREQLSRGPSSVFSYVEVAGVSYGMAMLRAAIGAGERGGDAMRGGVGGPAGTRPELASTVGGEPVALETRVALAAGVLRAMSLTHGFARLLVFVGHGAGVTNNPQAAGLHCGACGGQAGEVNARVLAGVLNDPAVRAGLAERGIALPETTHAVAGLHNTTTDDVTLYDLDQVPATHRDDVARLARALEAAGRRARAERAGALGLGGLSGDALDAAIRRRAADWSEVRPEWGLVRNAAFVVAPRERTRGVDLEGRAFLHEYRWEEDAGFGVLEQVMTAPMVVTNWINLQYYASTVDHRHYGSGNKVLHNVVGGNLGVFEGAGGDLRIGLALQSVHDGGDWVHEPLRLHVVIEAPAEAIDGVLAKHALVRDLVLNGWLFLFRLDAAGRMHQRRADGWHGVPRAASGSGRGVAR